MEIDVKEYLSDEEMKTIAAETFSQMIKDSMRGHEGSDEDFWHRIISNHSYKLVYKMIDDSITEDLSKLITSKTTEVIENLSAFTVFKPAEVWDRNPSKSYEIVQDAVKNNSVLVDDKIKTLIEGISELDLLELLGKGDIKFSLGGKK